jgi:hypothetical protein
MSKKNKIYWLEGVTEKGVKSLLSDGNSRFKWLRPQRNRRVLVVLLTSGLVLLTLGSYWPTLKTKLDLSSRVELTIYSMTGFFVVLAVVGAYWLLRISVRGIADAPDELLDERQIQVRNTSFRFAYIGMGLLVTTLFSLLLFGPELRMFQSNLDDGSYLIIAYLITFVAMPSMIMAWRERDI